MGWEDVVVLGRGALDEVVGAAWEDDTWVAIVVEFCERIEVEYM